MGQELIQVIDQISKEKDLEEPYALAIANSPAGNLFTVTHSMPGEPGTPQLASVNRAQGTTKPFGPNLGSEIFMGLGFSPEGVLYGVNSMSGTDDTGSLYQFNPATGKATKVGVTGGCFEIMDIAFHPDGTMYGAAWDSLNTASTTTLGGLSWSPGCRR